MMFNELKLEMAVLESDISQDPVSDEQRSNVASQVYLAWIDMFDDEPMPFTRSEIVSAVVRNRKSGKKESLALRVAKAHDHWQCFWSHRDKGPCLGEVRVGLLTCNTEFPTSDCFLECERHNKERGGRTIESYLMQEDEK